MFEIPADIAALDQDALAAAVTEALAEAEGFGEDDLSEDDVARMIALADFVTAARTVQGEREATAAAQAERLAQARAALAPVEEPAVEEAPVEEPALVAAAPKQPAIARAAKVAKAPEPTESARASLTAAADVPGFALGTDLKDFSGAAKAVMARLKSMPAKTGGNTFSRQGAVVIRKALDDRFVQRRGGLDGEELLALAGDESRLEGDSLVAAGGWGAPSETLLDFCKFEQAVGLLDLPTVGITRGGINYTRGPAFSDVLNSATGFIDQTEAQAIAGTPKTVLRPDLPDFTEVRLEAVGVIVEAGLLLRAAWPELVERYVEMALVAHEYKVSAKLLSKIEGYTGAAINVPNGYGNALDVLHVLEVVALGERQREAMADTQTLEVLLPFWVKGVIRADLAQRNGVDAWNVTDAQINAYFSNRGLRVQWLRQYQPLDVTTAGVAITYPDTVEAIMYPAGTYVKGTADVLTLDTVYDSVNLKNNDYLALFTEEGVLVTNPCGNGRRISLPLLANGRTAASSDPNDNLFNTPVA